MTDGTGAGLLMAAGFPQLPGCGSGTPPCAAGVLASSSRHQGTCEYVDMEAAVEISTSLFIDGVSQKASHVQHWRGAGTPAGQPTNRPRCGALWLETEIGAFRRRCSRFLSYIHCLGKLVYDSRGSPFSTRREFNNGPAAVLTLCTMAALQAGDARSWREPSPPSAPPLPPGSCVATAAARMGQPPAQLRPQERGGITSGVCRST